jgi:predicted nucleic acid-binding protein
MAFFAVLDACVLYPYSLRDTLLRFAEHEFYAPLWSDRILDEMERNIIKDGVEPEKAARMRALMEAAFDSASVPTQSIAAIEQSMTNDEQDRHVLAAAVTSEAEVVVTANLKHFPRQSAEPHDVEIQHPDEFLVHLFDLDKELAVALIEEQASDQRKPPITVLELLGMLQRAGVPRFSSLVHDQLAAGGEPARV